jgi:NADH-quinone oxidoreductase subunit N
MPLFAGFATKFILFQAAAQQDLLWLSSIAVFMSFVSLYYYLGIIKQMYLVEPTEKARLPVPRMEYAVVAVLIVGVLLVGLYPQPLFNGVENATSALFQATQAAAAAGAGM